MIKCAYIQKASLNKDWHPEKLGDCFASQEGAGAERCGVWEDLPVPAAEEHHPELAGTYTHMDST